MFSVELKLIALGLCCRDERIRTSDPDPPDQHLKGLSYGPWGVTHIYKIESNKLSEV